MARDTKQFDDVGKYASIQNAVTYIENNFTKDFPVDDLAKMSYLSPTSFRRLFFAQLFENCLLRSLFGRHLPGTSPN